LDLGVRIGGSAPQGQVSALFRRSTDRYNVATCKFVGWRQ
jgi:hypothetical protein